MDFLLKEKVTYSTQRDTDTSASFPNSTQKLMDSNGML